MPDFIVDPPSNSCDPADPVDGASLTSAVTYDGGGLDCLGIVTGMDMNVVLSAMEVVCNQNRGQFTTFNTRINNIEASINALGSASTIYTNDVIDLGTYTCISTLGTLADTLARIDDVICSLIAASPTPRLSQIDFNTYIANTGKSFIYKNELADGDIISSIANSTTIDSIDGFVTTDGVASSVTGAAVSTVSSKDNYIFADSTSQSFIVKDVTIGDPAPAALATEIVLYKLTLDGAGAITASVDLRQYNSIDESFFRLDTDVSGFIPEDSITGFQIDLSSVLSYDSVVAITNPSDIVHKDYVDTAVATVTPLWTASGADVYFNTGNVGIGTTADGTANLFVDGSFKYTDGNELDGSILTCDVNGYASWSPLSFLFEGQNEGTSLGSFTGINFIGAGVTAVSGGSGILDVTITGSTSSFLDLTDTPISYAGSANFFLRVNGGVNSVDFVEGSTINLSEFNNDVGFITSYTETDDLENVLSRDNSTGAYDISILSGQSLVYNNSGFTATISESTLAGNIVLTLPNITGSLIVQSYADSHIGGQNVDALIQSPTVTEDGYVVTWNNTNNEYELVAGGGGSDGNGIYDGSGVLGGDTIITQNNFNLELQGNGGLFTTNANTSWSIGAVLNSGFQVYQVVSTHSTGHYIIQTKTDVSSDVYGQRIYSASTKTGAATLYGTHNDLIGTHALGTNVAGYFNAENALNNYSALFNNGDIGFEQTAATRADIIKIVQSLGSITFDGTAGGLFSITDDKSGQLFGVADVSGNDIMYADADWLIKLGNPFQTGGVPLELDYNSTTGNTQMNLNSNTYNIGNLVDYADDTAAGVGGLVTGDLYRVTATKAIAVKD